VTLQDVATGGEVPCQPMTALPIGFKPAIQRIVVNFAFFIPNFIFIAYYLDFIAFYLFYGFTGSVIKNVRYAKNSQYLKKLDKCIA